MAFLILYAVDPETKMHLILPFLPSGVELNSFGIPSEHYTLIFNTFVFCQLVNLINARIVTVNKHNPFAGIFQMWLFPVVFLGITAAQVISILT